MSENKYGNQYQLVKSFYDWCIENGKQIYLDCWDYELNQKTPKEIGYQSNKKYWFKCPSDKHEKFQRNMVTLVSGKSSYFCVGCASIGQYIVDTYGKDYLNKIWSDKNTLNPFKILAGSKKKVWIKCLTDETHPDYDQYVSCIKKGVGCPYCAGHRVCLTNSLGYNCPESLELWSDKNSKSPYEYTSHSSQKVWWKCENGIHDDYKRKISNSNIYHFGCPECEVENHVYPTGENAPSWKGGVCNESMKIRKSTKYKNWRSSIFEKDNYTCQCCGKYSGRLQAHHIYSFAEYESLRFDINNGVTMCFNCHDSTAVDSLHNLYGVHDLTPQQLEEYINNKRKELGINIPFTIENYIKKDENDFKNYNDSNTKIKTKHFNIEFFRTTHSIPDSHGISITSPNGTIVMTGDFKFDLTPIGPMADLYKMASLGEKGVDLLIGDSTNALNEGFSNSESVVDETLGDMFTRFKNNRIIIATFASNIYRIKK